MSEFARANREVEKFLGVSWGQLCPQFGFNHNPQHLLICEVLTSFLTFHILLWLGGWISSRFLDERGGTDQRRPSRDTSMEELDNFSTMVDRTLTSIVQVESSATSQVRTTGERPQDIEKLKEEFQSRIDAIKSKWQREEEEPRLLPGEPDDVDEFHVTAALVVLYFALQAILSCMVSCSVGISTTRVAGGGVWAHYCLLTYAVSNSGTLPTGCLAFSFLLDWFISEGISTFPLPELESENPSYQPIGPAGGSRSRRRAADILRRQEEVADMKPKFVLLCLPELVPLVFMVMTHVIPFLFMFLWLTILMLIAVLVVIELVRMAVKRLASTSQRRVMRQTQVLMFLLYLFATVYIHTSVQVMTRVYAGEWRHGGSFDSLWWHLLIDTDGLAQCPWFSLVRVVDLPLRWL